MDKERWTGTIYKRSSGWKLERIGLLLRGCDKRMGLRRDEECMIRNVQLLPWVNDGHLSISKTITINYLVKDRDHDGMITVTLPV